MRLVWSQLADRQVDEALAFIVADDPAAARRWLEELLERVEALRRFRDAGRVVPELGRDEIRELLVGSYRIIYRRSEAAVEIAVVHHQARQFGEAGARIVSGPTCASSWLAESSTWKAVA